MLAMKWNNLTTAAEAEINSKAVEVLARRSVSNTERKRESRDSNRKGGRVGWKEALQTLYDGWTGEEERRVGVWGSSKEK